MKPFSYPVLMACVLSLVFPLMACAKQPQTKTKHTPPPIDKIGQLRLADNLDRDDGYCLDILGSGEYVRFDMPMTVHNCKPGLYEDEAVMWQADGKIRFPAYNACATAAGVNQSVLAGAAVMPRACGERSPFLESQYLQHFNYRDDGRIELADSGLCLTAGADSDATFDPSHRWRTLSMQPCQNAPLAQSQWVFMKLHSHADNGFRFDNRSDDERLERRTIQQIFTRTHSPCQGATGFDCSSKGKFYH